jgi:histidinol-phosphate aminotransferase
MSRLWSTILQDLQPYTAGEQPSDKRYIKLNTNENPYPPSPGAYEAYKNISFDDLRLYPDPQSNDLCRAIAEYHGLSPSQVFAGNGSDEILALVYMAFFKQERPILFPSISYSFYPVYCNLFNVDAVLEPLEEDFSLNLSAYSTDNGGIIFPNPNAPTGKTVSRAGIRRLLRRNTESVVVVDEAYVDFGAPSCVELIDEFPNLLVVQTFSKSRSLAGLRVGYALGHADLITGLRMVKDSFNSYPVDRVASQVCIASLADREYFESCCAKIMATRGRIRAELQKRHFEVIDSAANFIFVKPPTVPAETLYRKLKDAGILVRYFGRKPLLGDYCRISIGTDDDMNALLSAIDTILMNEETQK